MKYDILKFHKEITDFLMKNECTKCYVQFDDSSPSNYNVSVAPFKNKIYQINEFTSGDFNYTIGVVIADTSDNSIYDKFIEDITAIYSSSRHIQ